MLKVSVVGNENGLENLHEGWDDLIERCPDATIFQSWEWALAWHRHMGKGKDLKVLCVRDEEKLVGIAPFEVHRYSVVPFRYLRLIGTGMSDYLGFLLDGSVAEKAFTAILDWLEENKSSWDMLDLQQISEESPMIRTNAGPNADDDWLIQRSEQDSCHFIKIPDSWDKVLARVGKKTRFNLRYYGRLLSKDFNSVEYCTFPPAPQLYSASMPLSEWMQAFFQLHQSRWEMIGEPAVASDAERKDFLLEVAHRLADRGQLFMVGLKLNGQLAAVNIGFAMKNRAYYYLGGFNPEYNKYSLGTVLLEHYIKQAQELGLKEFNLLSGNDTFKERWEAQSRRYYHLIIDHGSLRSRLAGVYRRIRRRIGHRTRRALNRINIRMQPD